MIVTHQSRSQVYRQPFGAVRAGTPIEIKLKVVPENNTIVSVTFCYAYGLYGFTRSRIRMDRKERQHADEIWFETDVPMPEECCLFFYWFEIELPGRRVWYVANSQHRDGWGYISEHEPQLQFGTQPIVDAWQITVYKKSFHVPEWYMGAVMYQIFPDRFQRDRNFSLSRMTRVRPVPERIYHESWTEEVDFSGKPETGYLATDFFGGSLQGILEKLDYIESLGTTVIYLNPVFEARSNHRYDTADYEKVDPMLGSNDDLIELCERARERGIRIILDGVFSHTGADSKYFNKFNRYSEEPGAWQEANFQQHSRYGSWYTFHRKNNVLYYDSWWGFPDLPSVNEFDLHYRDFITGPDGIIRSWIRKGISGWRLDVSDELPDSFIRSIRRAVRAEDCDAVILGEIWEDASVKISYGGYRDFLLGRTHDNVMGYPFQRAVTSWLAGFIPAYDAWAQLETIRENYPLESFYSSMNLISSHDIPRAITTMAGQPDPGSRAAQVRLILSESERLRGQNLLVAAMSFQIGFPGIAALYYGDEIGMEGYRDPFNRRPFQWGKEHGALTQAIAELGRLRRDTPVLRTGYFRSEVISPDVMLLRRWFKQGADVFGRDQTGPQTALIAINRQAEPVTIQEGSRTLVIPQQGALIELDGVEVFRSRTLQRADSESMERHSQPVADRGDLPQAVN